MKVFGFVDGAYLRKNALEVKGTEFLNPFSVVKFAVKEINGAPNPPVRVNYYDAPCPADVTAADRDKVEKYWKAVERVEDTAVRFGSIRERNRKKPPQQKGVDVLLAVDLMVGAFTGLFDVALLVAGDADFLPVVQEVQRRGVRVWLAGFETKVSEELIDQCDRYVSANTVMQMIGPMQF